jgi:steroid delta-isomerase-like uncharacterized protein
VNPVDEKLVDISRRTTIGVHMTTEETTALFARRDEHWNRLDAVALAADYSEDCVVESPVAGRHEGPAAVERALRMIFSAFPDFGWHPQELLVSGNRVLQTVTVRGIDNGGFMGLPPTGRPFSVSAMFLFTMKDHLIVHERRTYDFSRLLLQLAGDAGPATEGPRLYRETLERARSEHELKTAAEIQQALLPKSRHTGTGFEVVATSVPCRAIGGDFFDYFDLSSGAFAFVLGDVAGKGAPAALLAAVLQGVFAANALREDTPATTLKQANDVLVHRAIQSRFATAVYAVLSTDGCLTYCNAGHNPPFLVGKCGVRRLESGGPIVGAFGQATFCEETLQLDPGDVLVVFSDGLTEAFDASGEEFGEERLLTCVKANSELGPTALLECLLDAVHQFSVSAAQSDDLTVLVLRYSGAKTLAA